jgi:hypothetical protein
VLPLPAASSRCGASSSPISGSAAPGPAYKSYSGRPIQQKVYPSGAVIWKEKSPKRVLQSLPSGSERVGRGHLALSPVRDRQAQTNCERKSDSAKTPLTNAKPSSSATETGPIMLAPARQRDSVKVEQSDRGPNDFPASFYDGNWTSVTVAESQSNINEFIEGTMATGHDSA